MRTKSCTYDETKTEGVGPSLDFGPIVPAGRVIGLLSWLEGGETSPFFIHSWESRLFEKNKKSIHSIIVNRLLLQHPLNIIEGQIFISSRHYCNRVVVLVVGLACSLSLLAFSLSLCSGGAFNNDDDDDDDELIVWGTKIYFHSYLFSRFSAPVEIDDNWL